MKGLARNIVDYRRLSRRSLPSLLRYKFLHEYGYDKGAVVVSAIVNDICEVVRNYYARPGDLGPGQLIYHAPAIGERGGRGKTMAATRLVPVRLTVVADEDHEAIRQGLPAAGRREVRVRRLTWSASSIRSTRGIICGLGKHPCRAHSSMRVATLSAFSPVSLHMVLARPPPVVPA